MRCGSISPTPDSERNFLSQRRKGPGALTLSGAAVSANDVVTKKQIDGGNLRYSPPANARS